MNISQKYLVQRAAQTDDGVIPLINVVFLMLIFFMVAGQIQKADAVKIEPPRSVNEAKAETDPNVLILVSISGEWFFNDQPVTESDLQDRLTLAFEEAADKEQFWIQIKADGELPVEKLAPIFTSIKHAGLNKVSIATQLTQG